MAAFDGLLAGELTHSVYNLGSDRGVRLDRMIEVIEAAVGKTALIDRQPDQVGDVKQTWADLSRSRQALGYAPEVEFTDGIRDFVQWMRR